MAEQCKFRARTRKRGARVQLETIQLKAIQLETVYLKNHLTCSTSKSAKKPKTVLSLFEMLQIDTRQKNKLRISLSRLFWASAEVLQKFCGRK